MCSKNKHKFNTKQYYNNITFMLKIIEICRKFEKNDKILYNKKEKVFY